MNSGILFRVMSVVAACGLVSGPAWAGDHLAHAFSRNRGDVAQALAAQLDRPLPAAASHFFSIAASGDWAAVSNAFLTLRTPGNHYLQIPTLRNELWAPAHEALGFWEVWEAWKHDTNLLARYSEPILNAMPAGSIYFGGTDQGRFVITAANAARTPPPVFAITQNQLADNTYAAHLRALYGKELWMPTQEDSNRIFADFVASVQTNDALGAGVVCRDGRVSVQGIEGVMMINGLIAREIHDRNKAAHPFFVEESYVIDWMYPYLTPKNLIMELHPEPLDTLPEELIARDRAFWAYYEKALFDTPGFAENEAARIAFSKLRSAIGGLYAYRKLHVEAEDAFRQAIRLYPASPEASMRLSSMFETQGRLPEAVAVMEAFVATGSQFGLDKAEGRLAELRHRMAPDEFPPPPPIAPAAPAVAKPVEDKDAGYTADDFGFPEEGKDQAP